MTTRTSVTGTPSRSPSLIRTPHRAVVPSGGDGQHVDGRGVGHAGHARTRAQELVLEAPDGVDPVGDEGRQPTER